MFHEFPKMLYQGDAQTIARDAQHEESLRVEGWHDFGDAPKIQAEEVGNGETSDAETTVDAQQPKTRRDRRPKIQAEE